MRVGLAALGGNFWHPIDLIRGKQTNLRYSGRKSITWGAGNNGLPGDQGIVKTGDDREDGLLTCRVVRKFIIRLSQNTIYMTKFIFSFTLTNILQKYRNFTKNSNISHSLIKLVNFAKHKKIWWSPHTHSIVSWLCWRRWKLLLNRHRTILIKRNEKSDMECVLKDPV